VSATLFFIKNYQDRQQSATTSPSPVLLSCCPVHLQSSASVEIPLLQEGISGAAVQVFSKPNPRPNLRKKVFHLKY
jgi:hypothetical protein